VRGRLGGRGVFSGVNEEWMVVMAVEIADFFREDLKVQMLESTDEFCVRLETEAASKLKGEGMDTSAPKIGGKSKK